MSFKLATKSQSEEILVEKQDATASHIQNGSPTEEDKPDITNEPSNNEIIEVTSATEEFQMATEDTSSQSCSSKGNSVNEITSLVDNLAVESDHYEKISTETVDIALLPATDDNESKIDQINDTDDENLRVTEDQKIIAESESLPICETDKWGENKRRQSLMMKNALKNSLDASAMEILKGNMDELMKSSANGCKTDASLESPDNDMYAWASSCANLNPVGPRFKLIKEGDIQVCYLDHTRTVISKILSFKFLRHFELHHLYLNESRISPKNVSTSFILILSALTILLFILTALT